MSTPNAMVGAARRITKATDVQRTRKHNQGWQDRCWDMYDVVGEYRYAVDWMGSTLSKAVLYIADADGKKVESGPAVDLLAALFGGPQGQAQMLGSIGVNWTVAGDCYLLGTTEDDKDRWQVVSATALTGRGKRYYVDSEEVKSSGDPFLCRLWRPHPRKYTEANSPSRAVLPILAEIEALTKRVAVEVDSRLTGAGMMILPDTVTFPTAPTAEGDEVQVQNEADKFVAYLQDVMGEAIAHPESASAAVPFAITVPPENVDQIKLLTFWSPLDENSPALRKEAIGRLALGLDMPPEVLTGMADLNHWNAWAVDDAGIKAHAEPLLALICAALTEGYLIPLLEDGKFAEATAGQTIQADTSSIRLRPNRSKEALELYDRGELSAEALRRETGFEEEDAPDDAEIREWYIRRVASGSTTPELVAQALALLGVQMQVAAPEEEPTEEVAQTPSLEDHPVQDAPEPPLAQVAAAGPPPELLRAAEQMVFRALERAGNRLKTRTQVRPPGVAAADLYQYVPVDVGTVNDLLVDAWTHVDRFCPDLGVDAHALTSALDSYCRAILIDRRPHNPDLLAAYLTLTAAAT